MQPQGNVRVRVDRKNTHALTGTLRPKHMRAQSYRQEPCRGSGGVGIGLHSDVGAPAQPDLKVPGLPHFSNTGQIAVLWVLTMAMRNTVTPSKQRDSSMLRHA